MVGSLKRVSALVAAVLAGSSIGIRQQAEPASVTHRTRVRLMTGTPGGGFYVLGERLAAAYTAALTDTSVVAHPSAGAIVNLHVLEHGEAELALTFADVAYLSYAGQLDRAAAPFERLRGVAVLTTTPLHFVVRKGFAFHHMRDLQGHRVSVGPPGSGTALTASLVFQTLGIDQSKIATVMLPFDRAAQGLIHGSLDAMFDNAIYPGESVSTATRAGAHLVSFSKPTINRLHHDYPFLKLTLIPRNTYPHTDAVYSIGVDTLLVCRSDLSEDFVYELTRALFDALPNISSEQNELRSADLEHAAATPIPLHRGAARYYRERELLR
jgi:TRAP transporter TAXI family solute receptor